MQLESAVFGGNHYISSEAIQRILGGPPGAFAEETKFTNYGSEED